MSPRAPSTDVLTGDAEPPLKLRLVVASGPDFGAQLALEEGSYRVGTDPGNHLVLTDSSVSRTHLEIGVLPEGLVVTDNQSTNGSSCDGVAFTRVRVKAGAELRIGRTVLRVLPANAPSPAIAPSARERFGRLTGRSLRMRELFALLERLALADADVLVEGETGTGKELCAEALHRESRRAKRPFEVCDLASSPPALFEAELFGHRKGAFTGATCDRAGVFERAGGGTVFLDELGELPLELQPRLLRVLEAREVKRVGDGAYRRCDVRIISATNRDLQAEVQEGRFRADLFHRLAVTCVVLPPLRERPEDVPLLIDEILRQLGKEPSQLGLETRAMLRSYSWPGNVRELRNVVERVISLGVLPPLEPLPGPPSRSASSEPGLPFKEAKERLIASFERDYLAGLLGRNQGNLSRAAREAGIDRVYLKRLLRKHRLAARRS